MSKRVMLYGSVPTSLKAEGRKVVGDFVTQALAAGWKFTTRSGSSRRDTDTWPGAKADSIPVDDFVFEAVQSFVASNPSTNIRRAVRTYENEGRVKARSLGQEILACPTRRYEMYSRWIHEVDIFIFIGGSDGVLRLGLVSHFQRQPFLALAGFGGAAAELAESFYELNGAEYCQHLQSLHCLRLARRDLTGAELLRLSRRNTSKMWLFADLGRGRMTLATIAEHLKQGIEGLAGRLSKVLLFAFALLIVLVAFREQVEQVAKLLGEVWNK